MADEQQEYADGMTAFDAYYGVLNEMYGRKYPSSRYHAHRLWKKFLKVGKTCRKNGWDIEQYVRTVVSYSKKESDEITPADIVGPAKEQVFLAHRASSDRVPPILVWERRERELLMIQSGTGKSDADVLASPLHTGFPAWFRLFYPERLDDRILETYWVDAVEEMHADRDVLLFLRGMVPSRLAEAEKRMGVVDGL